MIAACHVHSWYSLLEGVGSAELLVDRAAELGYSALALTDTNNLFGMVPFCKLATRRGIRPIIGSSLRQGASQAIALMEGAAGYRSLCRILSSLHLEPVRRLPELLAVHSEGLYLLLEDLQLASRLRDVYPDRLGLEVVRPSRRSVAEESAWLEQARASGLPLVASLSALLATPEDYSAYRLATAVRSECPLDRLPPRLDVVPAHHLIGPKQWHARFRDVPQAVAEAERLTERLLQAPLPFEPVQAPASVPRQGDADDFLRRLCERGLRRRKLDDDPTAHDRLKRELAWIAQRGLASYYLLVRDIARCARARGQVTSVRGSAGQSLICFLLELSEVDPLRFDLPLDPFFDFGAGDLPDLAIEIDAAARPQLFDDIGRRYGADRTARIGTLQYMQPGTAFRAAARAHGLSAAQASRMTDALGDRIEVLVRDPSQPAARTVPAGFPLESVHWTRLLYDARRLAGRPHQLMANPNSLVLSNVPLMDRVPLQPSARGETVTQFDRDAVAALGLARIDLVGNHSLGALAALQPRPNSAAAEGDFDTLELFRRGATLGIRQAEGAAVRQLLTRLRPHGVEDVAAAFALARLGTNADSWRDLYVQRHRGLETYDLDPLIEPPLRETFGVPLYENDALAMIAALTGLSTSAAHDFYQRVVQCDDDRAERALARDFFGLCARRQVAADFAMQSLLVIGKFRRQRMRKGHALGQALLAWKLAEHKVHHPLEFWVSVLNGDAGVFPRRVYVEAIKRAGIAVRRPCVNRSEARFCIESGSIRTGLEAIWALPAPVRETVLRERPFLDLLDFRERVPCEPGTLKMLIRVGAFDFTERTRPELLAEVEQGSVRKPIPRLFEDWYDCEPWSPEDHGQIKQWQEEWDLLGFLPGPPAIALFADQLPSSRVQICELAGRVGEWVEVAGLLAVPRNASKSAEMIILEDETGMIDVRVQPRHLPRHGSRVALFHISGEVEENLGALRLIAHDLTRADATTAAQA